MSPARSGSRVPARAVFDAELAASASARGSAITSSPGLRAAGTDDSGADRVSGVRSSCALRELVAADAELRELARGHETRVSNEPTALL